MNQEIEFTNYLHIYAQSDWHAPAHIIGSKLSLTTLRDAINQALESGDGKCESFTNDGEGFDAVVIRVDDPKQFVKMHVPYMLDIAKEKPSDAFDKLITRVERKQ